jgi:hypothetical protein
MKIREIKFIKEGGYALKDVGVTRINREDIPTTLQFVSHISGIPIEDMFPLGSTGKTSSSGDIDVAVDINTHNPQSVHANMVKVLGDDYAAYNAGTKVGSYAIPIAGNADKGLVQVDFMYVSSTKWAQFSYASAGDKSEYKGAIRRMLLQAVASVLDQKGIDKFVYDDKSGDLIVRVGRSMDMNLGLKRIFQMRPKKVRGDGYLSTMKSVTPDDIKSVYPDLDFVGDSIVIDDPQEALNVMFGGGINIEDVETAEQIIQLIKDRFLPATRRIIFDRTNEKTKTVAHQMKVPTL